MSRKDVAVLDIGSSKLRVVMAQSTGCKSFNITGISEIEYSGFNSGEFLDSEELYSCLNKAITTCEESAEQHISKLYVGLPAEFLFCSVKEASVQFDSRKKILKSDVEYLTDKANEFKNNQDLTLISADAISFCIDGRKISEAINQKGQKLFAKISYQYAKSEMIRLLNECFSKIGLSSVVYLSSASSQIELLSQNARTDIAVMVDCGYITSHVSVISGDALTFLGSFSMGGGHIMADLAQCLEINYSFAEILKRKLALSVSPDENEKIEIVKDGEIKTVSYKLANDIACSRIEIISKAIEKCIELSGEDYPKYFPIFLTGGGISLMKGIKQFLSKTLSQPVEIITYDGPLLSKPYHTSIVGLVKNALKKEKEYDKSFLAKIFKKW